MDKPKLRERARALAIASAAVLWVGCKSGPRTEALADGAVAQKDARVAPRCSVERRIDLGPGQPLALASSGDHFALSLQSTDGLQVVSLSAEAWAPAISDSASPVAPVLLAAWGDGYVLAGGRYLAKLAIDGTQGAPVEIPLERSGATILDLAVSGNGTLGVLGWDAAPQDGEDLPSQGPVLLLRYDDELALLGSPSVISEEPSTLVYRVMGALDDGWIFARWMAGLEGTFVRLTSTTASGTKLEDREIATLGSEYGIAGVVFADEAVAYVRHGFAPDGSTDREHRLELAGLDDLEGVSVTVAQELRGPALTRTRDGYLLGFLDGAVTTVARVDLDSAQVELTTVHGIAEDRNSRPPLLASSANGTVAIAWASYADGYSAHLALLDCSW